MMYDWYGSGSVWMMLMPVLWIVLIGLIVWAAVRLAQDRSGPQRTAGHRDPVNHRDSPEEILDRRFARGEIDTDAYISARERLIEHRRASS